MEEFYRGKIINMIIGYPRRAFDAMVKDPEYVADMNAQGLEFTPMGGEELQKFVAEIDSVPPAILDKVKAIYPLN